jgi:hypothetical protein
MGKWNEEAAPNLSLSVHELEGSKFVPKKKDHEFSEELSDGGERNKMIASQLEQKRSQQ